MDLIKAETVRPTDRDSRASFSWLRMPFVEAASLLLGHVSIVVRVQVLLVQLVPKVVRGRLTGEQSSTKC